MPPIPAMQPDTCFLSYSRADEQFALRFANDLRSLGVVMWVDQLNIRPSEHWDRAIERTIRGCRSLVVILSPRAVASDNVADEVSLAIDIGKAVIPVMIEACALPLRLNRMHLIDAARGYEQALRQCLNEIKDSKCPSNAVTGTAADCCAILNPQILAAAKQQLATIIGPIAGIIVEQVASRTASVEGLYDHLTMHLRDVTVRERFVALTSQHRVPRADAELHTVPEIIVDGGKIRRADIERIARILTSYLGPIALLVTRRESKASKSVKDLLRRLAATLRSECDRADFLKRVETH
jgi:hypothetical protein